MSDNACNARCAAVGLSAVGPAAVKVHWLKLFANASVSSPRDTPRLTTGTERIELYRLAPVQLAVDLTNADSGDSAGDVFFGVMEAQLQCYNSAKTGQKPRLFSCRDDPMSEGTALRLGTAVYTRFTVDVNNLWSDYTMCNAAPAGGYTCVPEWNCVCSDSTGGYEGGGGETCGCVGWGSGSMHLPDDAPAFWRNHSIGVGRNDVEAEWGSTGGGHVTENCSRINSQIACTKARCKWSAGNAQEHESTRAEESRCENVFDVAEALTCAADRVGGYWFSTQGPGENTSWQVVGKTVANATCVNAAVNALVDRAGAAACRKQRQCPGDGSYPRDGEERNCWVECFASTVVGSDSYPGTVKWDGAPTAGLSRTSLVQAFEAAWNGGSCAMAA